MVAKRAPSAYFVFANEQRATTKEELLATATNGKAPSVADVAKSIGHKWRELGEAGQQAYKNKAAALAAEAAVSATTESAADESSQAEAKSEAAEPDDSEVPGLPLMSVKRIMCTDQDVARVSGDCVKAVAKATEMFLQLLASRAYSKAKHQKRSTIKFFDMCNAVIADKRMVEMGLKDMFAHEALFADARSEGKENVTAVKKSGKATAESPGARPITYFFRT